MAEEQGTPPIRSREDLRQEIIRRVAAAHIGNAMIQNQIIGEAFQRIGGTVGDVTQIAPVILADVDKAVEQAKTEAQQREQDKEKQNKGSKIEEERFVAQNEEQERQQRFNALVQKVEEAHNTLAMLNDTFDWLDEQRKKRGVKTSSELTDMARKDPEAFLDHFATVEVDIKAREIALREADQSLKTSEKSILQMGKEEGVEAESVDVLKKKIRDLPPVEVTEGIKTINKVIEIHEQKAQNVENKQVELRDAYREKVRCMAVSNEQNIAPPTLERKLAKTEEMEASAPLQSREIFKKVAVEIQQEKNRELQQGNTELQQGNTELQERDSVHIEMFQLVDGDIREKLGAFPQNPTVEQYLTAIERNPHLLEQEEIAYVYNHVTSERSEQLGPVGPEVSLQKTGGQYSTLSHGSENLPPIKEEDKKQLEEVAKTLQKNWVQSVKQPSAPLDSPTHPGNGGGRGR